MKKLIKVCGLTDPVNIVEVMKLRPDMAGFIFYPPSPRYVKNINQLQLINQIADKPLIVGVFVNPDLLEIMEVHRILHLDVVQLHGSESPELAGELRSQGIQVIKAFGIRSGFDFHQTDPYQGCTDYFLFDTGGLQPGGNGIQFDWELMNRYQGDTPFLLSGGLSPDTVTLPVHPRLAGVDLNSRFESAPGIKNIEQLKKFFISFKNE